MKELKKYHQRKLAIIEMIEECERCIDKEKDFMERNGHFHELRYLSTSHKNIERYEHIKNYLTERYNRLNYSDVGEVVVNTNAKLEKLISCAPEMLEMLIKLSKTISELIDQNDGFEQDYVEIIELIKKAKE